MALCITLSIIESSLKNRVRGKGTTLKGKTLSSNIKRHLIKRQLQNYIAVIMKQGK